MRQRSLYLAAYDSANALRRTAMLRLLRAFARGGQESAYEVELGQEERRKLLRAMAALMDPLQDRFQLVRLDPRGAVLASGRGAGAGCIYLG